MPKSDSATKPATSAKSNGKTPQKTGKPAKAVKKPKGEPEPIEEDEYDSGGVSQTTKLAVLVYTISVVFHVLLLGVLSFFYLPEDIQKELLSIVSEQTEEPEENEEEQLDPIENAQQLIEETEVDSNQENVESEVVEDQPNPLELDVDDLPAEMMVMDFPIANAAPAKISTEVHGRSQKARSQMLAKYGGSTGSEKAVSSGLKWLKSVQHSNGSWDFHELKDNKGAGELKNCPTGATGLALLCYLGAGHTHEQGSYKDVVEKGLVFLMNSIRVTPEGGDLRGEVQSNEGMYVQGICATALCELYAMTPTRGKYRRQLKRAAELAIQFVITAQDPKGGGWRYRPRQAGDTSVVGWQLMALKSAENAGLPIPSRIWTGAGYFLDSVTADGAAYGYVQPGDRPAAGATTACGLLCRMYLKWTAQNEGLQKGIQLLAKKGPSGGKTGQRSDMYYNYYATQVMHHWGGEVWNEWNLVMREGLVKSQRQDGPETGSWDATGGHAGAKGGRLFQTALSIMTLEVYYRHLPIYKRKNTIADDAQL